MPTISMEIKVMGFWVFWKPLFVSVLLISYVTLFVSFSIRDFTDTLGLSLPLRIGLGVLDFISVLVVGLFASHILAFLRIGGKGSLGYPAYVRLFESVRSPSQLPAGVLILLTWFMVVAAYFLLSSIASQTWQFSKLLSDISFVGGLTAILLVLDYRFNNLKAIRLLLGKPIRPPARVEAG